MANFTSKQLYQLPKYVPQYDLESTVKVGMLLQNKFDQGIAKIQQNLDAKSKLPLGNYAGMELMQSKLDEASQEIERKIGTVDFANTAEVNSLVGLIDEKTNDMNLLNNIQSGMEINSAKEQLERDKKEGKINPANEYDLLVAINKFKNSKDITDVFVNPYFTPTDILERLNGLLKDNFDKSGNTRVYMTPNGRYGVLNETELIQRGQLKEVQQMINNWLYTDPLIQRQAYTNARYMYKDISDEDLKNQVVKQFDDENGILAKELKDKEDYYNLFSPEEREKNPDALKLRDDIKNLNEYSLEMEKKRKEFVESNPNRDGLAFFLYTNSLAGFFSGVYGFTSIKEKQVADPGQQADLELKKFIQKSWKDAQDVRQADEQLYINRLLAAKSNGTDPNSKKDGKEKTPKEIELEQDGFSLDPTSTTTLAEETQDPTAAYQQFNANLNSLIQQELNYALKIAGDYIRSDKGNKESKDVLGQYITIGPTGNATLKNGASSEEFLKKFSFFVAQGDILKTPEILDDIYQYSNIVSTLGEMKTIKENMQKEGFTEEEEDKFLGYVSKLRGSFEKVSQVFKNNLDKSKLEGKEYIKESADLIDKNILNSDQNIGIATNLIYEINNVNFFEGKWKKLTSTVGELWEKSRGVLTNTTKGEELAEIHNSLSKEIFNEYKGKIKGLTLDITKAVMTEFLAAGIEGKEWKGFYNNNNALALYYKGEEFTKRAKDYRNTEKKLSLVYSRYLKNYLKERNLMYTVNFAPGEQEKFFGKLKNSLSEGTGDNFKDKIEIINGLYGEKGAFVGGVLGVVPSASINGIIRFVIGGEQLDIPSSLVPSNMVAKVESLKQDMNINNTYHYAITKDKAVNLYVGALGVDNTSGRDTYRFRIKMWKGVGDNLNVQLYRDVYNNKTSQVYLDENGVAIGNDDGKNLDARVNFGEANPSDFYKSFMAVYNSNPTGLNSLYQQKITPKK